MAGRARTDPIARQLRLVWRSCGSPAWAVRALPRRTAVQRCLLRVLCVAFGACRRALRPMFAPCAAVRAHPRAVALRLPYRPLDRRVQVPRQSGSRQGVVRAAARFRAASRYGVAPAIARSAASHAFGRARLQSGVGDRAPSRACVRLAGARGCVDAHATHTGSSGLGRPCASPQCARCVRGCDLAAWPTRGAGRRCDHHRRHSARVRARAARSGCSECLRVGVGARCGTERRRWRLGFSPVRASAHSARRCRRTAPVPPSGWI